MTAKGWLLSMRGQVHVAVGARELIYVLPEEPELHSIPLAPEWAPGVIVWENRLVPVIDVGVILRGADEAADDSTAAPVPMRQVVAIVAFAGEGDADADAELGALILGKVPEQVDVADDQACELPEDLLIHGELFISCFDHPELGSVPVLNLVTLFSGSGCRTADPRGRTALMGVT